MLLVTKPYLFTDCPWCHRWDGQTVHARARTPYASSTFPISPRKLRKHCSVLGESWRTGKVMVAKFTLLAQRGKYSTSVEILSKITVWKYTPESTNSLCRLSFSAMSTTDSSDVPARYLQHQCPIMPPRVGTGYCAHH